MTPDADDKRTILLADDNPQMLELLEAYLDPLSLRVVTAMDGQTALSLIESERPDVVLLDVMMPKRSGFEVCRMVKEDPRLRDVPVVMVTALNESGDRERARECGADDFLTKPVNKLELVDCVENLLKARQLREERAEFDDDDDDDVGHA